jgi:hypothetical protein
MMTLTVVSMVATMFIPTTSTSVLPQIDSLVRESAVDDRSAE